MFSVVRFKVPLGSTRLRGLARRPYVRYRSVGPRARATPRAMDSHVRRREAQRSRRDWRKVRNFYRRRDGRISFPLRLVDSIGASAQGLLGTQSSPSPCLTARARAASLPSTTDAEEYVLDQRGIIRVAPRASQDGKARQLADLEKDPRVNRTGIEDQARELHARHVGDLHRFFPPPWHQRWEAETQHHGVGPENADRLVEIVDAGRQDQMLAASQCIINLVHVVSRLGDEEVGDRDRRTGCRSVSPSNSRGISL